MQILPEDKSSLAFAGSQLGQGLANAFQNEFAQSRQAGRLSSALQEMQGQNLTPLQQAQNLIGARASDSQLAMLLPLIQQQMARNAQKERAQSFDLSNNLESQKIIPKEEQIQKQIEKAPELKSIVSKELEKEFLEPYRPLSPEQEITKASQLMESFPGIYLSVEDALKKIREEEGIKQQAKETKRAEYEKQSAFRDKLLNEYERKTKTILENLNKEQLFDDATGLYINKIEKEMENRVANGESIKSASDWGSEKINRFANKRLDIKTNSNKWFPKGLDQLYKNAQSVFAEAGQEKLYENQLIADGKLSRPEAAKIAYPLSKEVKKWISEKKPLERKNVATGVQPDPFVIQERSAAAANQLPKFLSEKDSLLAIAKSLEEEKGVDPEIFMEQLNIMYQNGFLPNLTEDQIDQLTKVTDFKPSWGDIYKNYR